MHSNYKVPNRKKWLLTDNFLIDLKIELDKVFQDRIRNITPTYWNFYAWIDSTGGFCDALKVVSEKHNVEKAIYRYTLKLPRWDSDAFYSELIEMMKRKGIIEEGVSEEYPLEEWLKEMENKGEIEWVEEAVQRKGYKVVTRDWIFVKQTK